MKNRFVFVIVLFLFLSSFPIFLGMYLERDGNVFGGIILNPIDGYTYLAKMQIGYSGEWIYTLPYTAIPGEGGYLFLFYIILGHLARLFHISPIIFFHIARIAGSLYLVLTLYRFVSNIAGKGLLNTSFSWLLFGSGLGWIVLPTGYLPSDMWVAESYPFLSALANPHFPVGIGLMLELFILFNQQGKKAVSRNFLGAVLAFLLANIMPFGYVILICVLFIDSIWNFINKRKFNTFYLFWLGIGGMPVCLYQIWISNFDPVLKIWNQQNITTSPPLLDFLISFSPAIMLAGVLLFTKFGGIDKQKYQLLIIWMVVCVVFAYSPISLQRRFLIGFYVPIVILASVVIDYLPFVFKKGIILIKLIISVSFISNLLLLFIILFGMLTNSPTLYISRNQQAVLSWLNENASRHDVILAPVDLSLLIPAYTGKRVVYGHPFETANADQAKSLVDNFYMGYLDIADQERFLNEYKVNFIVYPESVLKTKQIHQRDYWNGTYLVGDYLIVKIENFN